MQSWTLPPSFNGQLFCLSSYCPTPIRLHTIPVGIMVNMFWGGGSYPPCFVSYVRATTQTAIHCQRPRPSLHTIWSPCMHTSMGFIPSQLTRSVPTQNIPVGIIFAHPVGVFLANPVGTISYYISYYRPGLFSFDKTSPDRDYPRSRK